ncbi:MAG: bifunctional oligoribonuclease/PAP phosphatase NrnA [Candidatus Kapabacteria bacterium]|nr:bifunctional oligoribonuclease/PAP phosphatase NrnA [Candidatus Kapabacteria bacterium]
MPVPANILESITASHRAVITAHINPDGDAVGSSLGLWHLLRAIGCNATVVLPNAAPSNLMWMEGAENIVVFGDSARTIIAEADTIFVLDLNAISRLGEIGVAIKASTAKIVNIDHHTFPEDFASVAWVDVDACSAGIMIAMCADALNSFTPAMAMCLYTGIMTDTGSFRFPRTTSHVHRMVAKLIDEGADPVRSFDEVMNRGSIGRTRLLGIALSTMSIYADGALCTMIVRRADMITNECTTEDVEGFVSQTLALQGVQIGILFVELETETKCSFRSKGTTYVRDLAAQYGGGGHVYAAGARVKDRPFDEVVAEVTAKAIDALTK